MGGREGKVSGFKESNLMLGLKYSITFAIITHMPFIDIQILAVCRMFVP